MDMNFPILDSERIRPFPNYRQRSSRGREEMRAKGGMVTTIMQFTDRDMYPN
jgi:hypothetical protein